MRPFDQELVTCKRYWNKIYPSIRFQNYVAVGAFAGHTIVFPVEMRAVPTLGTMTGFTNQNVAALGLTSATTTGCRFEVTTAAVVSDTYSFGGSATVDARL
jgi:hypothetical protein